ncbi:MAG: M48 family metalloprotease [Bacteroidales bacterium]|nr:M48 family metalloprotease [Bacteroidales bacterium]
MRKILSIVIIAIISIAFIFTSCKKDKDDDTSNIDFILKYTFPISKDKEFGAQFDKQLDSNKTEFPVLPDTGIYHFAYVRLDSMKKALLKSDNFDYAEDFKWQIKIIDKDVLNAFCAPAGYMYYYTGLIKYLDNEAQLAGVMGHEMAHADKRHVTKTLIIANGVNYMIGLILGDDPSKMEELISQYAAGIGVLKFSREHEYEADEMAVKYTADTDYYPKGISGFFIKLEAEKEKGIRMPEFLSTHPNPGNRLEAIDSVYVSIGSPPGELFEERYQELKSYLP